MTGSVGITGSLSVMGGNVGIGTPSPSQKLHLSDASNVYVRVQQTSGADVYLGGESSLGVLSISNSFPLEIRTNNTARLTIASTGAATFSSTNLTLQSSAESEVRSLSTSTGNYANFIVDTDNTTNYRLQMVGFGTTASGTLAGINRAGNGFVVKSGGLLAVGTRDANALVFSTNETERMRITSGGDVGIGITTPLSPLHQVTELTNYTGESRIGGSTTAFGIVTSYTQNAATSGSIYLSPGYGNSGILFKLGAGSGNTNQLVLTGAGGIGINLASPTNRFDVTNEARSGTHGSSQTMYVTGDFSAGDSGSAAKNNVEFRHVNGTQGIGFGYNSIYAAGSSANQNLCLTSKGTGNLILNGNANGAYTSGNVQVGGTTATDAKLYVKGASATSSNFAFLVNNSTPGDLLYCRNDGLINTGAQSASPYNNSTSGRSMVIESGGGLGYTSSTRESKTNIETISNVNWINQLNPVSFNYRKKDDERNYTDEFYEEKSYGFIADEVETINPNFVFYNDKEDSTKELAGVKYESMTAILVKAIQELKAENDTLKDTLQRNNII